MIGSVLIVAHLLLWGSPTNGLSPLSYIHSMRDQVAQRFSLKNAGVSLSSDGDSIQSTQSSFSRPNTQTGQSDAPLYNFKGGVVKNDDKNVDNIFSLLADIDHSDSNPPAIYTQQLHLNNPSDYGRIEPVPNHLSDSPADEYDFKVLNEFSKKAMMISKEMEDLVSTVTKVKQLYMTQKSKQELDENNTNKDGKIPVNSELEPTSAILDVFLDPSNLEKMWDASVKARNEDELLEELTSVIIGAEDRGGSALTLDPVTIIALLTLAAYLIRAVYQILTVTGRSLDVGGPGVIPVPEGFSNLPQAMVTLHNWVSPSNIEYARMNGRDMDGSNTDTASDWQTVPGTLAGLIKLQREGEHQCYQKLLCHHLASRPGPSVALEDLFIMISNYIYEEKDFGLYIDNALGMTTNCSKFSEKCSKSKLKDAEKIQLMYTAAIKYTSSFISRFTSN